MGGSRYLLLLLLLRPAASSEPETVMNATVGAVGKSVTFHIPGQMKSSVFWNIKDFLRVIVNSTGYPQVLDEAYKDRVSLSERGMALTLSRLGPEDAGVYVGQVDTRMRYVFTLQVFAELTPPAVTCSRRNCSAGVACSNCSAAAACLHELRCAAPGPRVSYGWSGGSALHAAGPVLELPRERPLRELPPVTCTARNPVSSSNATVQPAAACAVGNASRKALYGIFSVFYIGIGIGAVAVVVLIAVGIFCFRRFQGTLSWPVRPNPGTDAGTEAVTVYARVGPTKQGPTQAKKAPTAAEETSKTIYSTVQRAAQPQTDDEKIGGAAAAPGEKSLYATVSAVPGSMELL